MLRMWKTRKSIVTTKIKKQNSLRESSNRAGGKDGKSPEDTSNRRDVDFP